MLFRTHVICEENCPHSVQTCVQRQSVGIQNSVILQRYQKVVSASNPGPVMVTLGGQKPQLCCNKKENGCILNYLSTVISLLKNFPFKLVIRTEYKRKSASALNRLCCWQVLSATSGLPTRDLTRSFEDPNLLGRRGAFQVMQVADQGLRKPFQHLWANGKKAPPVGKQSLPAWRRECGLGFSPSPSCQPPQAGARMQGVTRVRSTECDQLQKQASLLSHSGFQVAEVLLSNLTSTQRSGTNFTTV